MLEKNLQNAIEFQTYIYTQKYYKDRGSNKSFQEFSMREKMDNHMILKANKISFDGLDIKKDGETIAKIVFEYSNKICKKTGYAFIKSYKIAYL